MRSCSKTCLGSQVKHGCQQNGRSIRNQPIPTSPMSNQQIKTKPFKIRNGPCFTAHSCAIAHDCELARHSVGNLRRDIHDVLCQPQQYVVILVWLVCFGGTACHHWTYIFKKHCCPVWLVGFMDEVIISFAILAVYDVCGARGLGGGNLTLPSHPVLVMLVPFPICRPTHRPNPLSRWRLHSTTLGRCWSLGWCL